MDNNVSKNTFCYKFFKLHAKRENLAMKKLLNQQITFSIESYQRHHELNTKFKFIEPLIADKVALCGLNKFSSLDVVYRCAIAFPLANHWHLSPLKLAQTLREFLPTADVISTTENILVFKVKVESPGWIDFYISDNALAVWLEALVAWVSQDRGVEGQESGDWGVGEDLLLLQYAHARCCSLLRLGHQEKLIKIKQSYSGWEIVEPLTLSWVNAREIFLLRHPTEKHLLIQLLMVLDELITHSQKVSWEKLAHNLSEVFLDFWANCPIYGEVKQKTPDLAQARLGLVALVQYFLAKILQNKLSISPMTEL